MDAGNHQDLADALLRVGVETSDLLGMGWPEASREIRRRLAAVGFAPLPEDGDAVPEVIDRLNRWRR